MKTGTMMVFIAIVFVGCDPVDTLKVINKSSETIFFELSYNRKIHDLPIRKGAGGDTLWQDMNFVHPKDSVKLPLIGRDGWKDVISKRSSDSTLTVFIFDDGLLRNISQDCLDSKQLYSKKFSYKVKDLEKLNWRVEYKR